MFCCGMRRTKALNLLSPYDCSVLHTFIRPPLVSSDRLRLQEAGCKRAYAAQPQNTLCTGGEKSSTISEGSWAGHPQFCPAGLCTGPSASFSHGAPFSHTPRLAKLSQQEASDIFSVFCHLGCLPGSYFCHSCLCPLEIRNTTPER